MIHTVKTAFTRPLLTVVSVMVTFIILAYVPLAFNVTDSAPVGLYYRTSVHELQRGDWVGVCLSGDIALLGRQRGYLSSGQCPSHTTPLLKQVIGRPGDTVRLTKSSILVNKEMINAPRHAFDRLGRRLTVAISESTSNGKTAGYWIYGANNPDQSWDSRYFGPVTRGSIIGQYHALFTLGRHNKQPKTRAKIKRMSMHRHFIE